MVAKGDNEAKGKSKSVVHPGYPVMVLAAITELKTRKGCTKRSIAKYVKANYNGLSEKSVNGYVNIGLKRLLDSDEIVATKHGGYGFNGRFKLKAYQKKPKDAKKFTAEKPSVKKSASARKKNDSKKPASPKKKSAQTKKSKSPAKKKAAAKKPSKTTKSSPKKKTTVKKATTLTKTPTKRQTRSQKQPGTPKK